jgi:NAD-dependent SIR2 family protein deacetylase
MVRKMMEAQGFVFCHASEETAEEGCVGSEPAATQGASAGDGSSLQIRGQLNMTIPSELVPHCPKCGKPMSMNLRADNTFVEDEGWHRAAERYDNFLRTRENTHILYLELGVGYNTPGIIKYPFWQMTLQNPKAVYACLNYGEALCPGEIERQSICIDGDIGDILEKI